MKPFHASPLVRVLLALVALAAIAVASLPWWLNPIVSARLRARAAREGLELRWSELRLGLPPRAALRDLVAWRAGSGDTVARAAAVEVALDPWSLATLRPRVAAVSASEAEIVLPAGGGAAEDAGGDPDVPDDAGSAAAAAPKSRAERRREDDAARGARLRRSAEALVRALTGPFERLPDLALREVTLRPEADADALWRGVRIGWLERRGSGAADRLSAAGTLLGEQDRTFEATFEHARDGRWTGMVRVAVPDEADPEATLEVSVDGRLTRDARTGTVTLDDSTRLRIGEIPLRVGGRLSRAGPALSARFEAVGLTEDVVERSLPASVLGPLREIGVDGSWDHRASLDLDLSRPDSVRFTSDVVPHRLALDPERTYLNLLGLNQPFHARILLPRDETATRLLDVSSPSFTPLAEISPALVHAVVTNEDGGFFGHRGFNTGALHEAIAENLHTGAFRRGAGTITMQLARNLYTGHRRVLSRKFQEVVLAWVIEHLTGVGKERLLEIYLNVIEWGPGVHGAEEAARWYFDRPASRLDLDEALFLATVVPSPRRWTGRFEKDGTLRLSTRQQMAFIARKMASKGWLDPAAVPEAEDLRVRLRGAAREVLEARAGRAPGSGDGGNAEAPREAALPAAQPARFAAITSAAPAK